MPNCTLQRIYAFSVVLLVAQTLLCQNCSGTSWTLLIDPQSTYLRTSGDTAKPSAAIPLSAYGIGEGDYLSITTLGSFIVKAGTTHLGTEVTAIFSATDELQSEKEINRVKNAIPCGARFETPRTAVSSLDTDVQEDFLVSSTTVQVPVGAKFIFFSPVDSYFGDNETGSQPISVRLILEKDTPLDIISTFAENADGWEANLSSDKQATGGPPIILKWMKPSNPTATGFIVAKAMQSGSVAFSAPPKFLGTKRAYYGAELSWLTLSSLRRPQCSVAMVGSGKFLETGPLDFPSGDDWNRMAIRLDTSAGWTNKLRPFAKASVEDIRSVLENLESLSLLYPPGQDADYGIDNVLLSGSVLGDCYRPPGGLVAWWRGDESGKDETGNLNLITSESQAYGEGRLRSAFKFNGRSNNLFVPNTPKLNLNALTISTWVKFTGDFSHHQDIVSKDGELLDRQYLIAGTFARHFRAHIGHPPGLDQDFPQVNGTTTIVTNQWYHTAFTFDGTTLKLYVNGMLEALTNSPGSIVATSEPLRIGGGAPDTTTEKNYLNGLVDEVQVFERALNASEIYGIFASGIHKTCAACDYFPTGSIANWKFETDFENGRVQDSVGPNDGDLRQGAHLVRGLYGNAADFGGTNSMIDLGPLRSLSGATGLTVAAWILERDPEYSYGGIVGQWGVDTDGDSSFLLYNGEQSWIGKLSFVVTTDDGRVNWVRGTTKISSNRWHHVVGTWDGATGRLSLYKNGQMESQTINAGTGRRLNRRTDITAKLGAWGRIHSYRHSWNGLIDETAVWNRALSPDEVQQLYSRSCYSSSTAPPDIVEHPRNKGLLLGESVVLSTFATGAQPLSYSWIKNGKFMGADDAPFLNLSRAKLSDAGEYAVVVSNRFGTVVSRAASVLVFSNLVQQPNIVFVSVANGARSVEYADGVRFYIEFPEGVTGFKSRVSLNGVSVDQNIKYSVVNQRLYGHLTALKPDEEYEMVVEAIGTGTSGFAKIRFDTYRISQSPLAVVPIVPSSPTEFHTYTNGLVFEIRSSDTVEKSDVKLELNGEDITDFAAVEVSGTNVVVSYNGLQPFRAYHAVVRVQSRSRLASYKFNQGPTVYVYPFSFATKESPAATCGNYLFVNGFDEVYFSISDLVEDVLPWTPSIEAQASVIQPILGVIEGAASGCLEFGYGAVKVEARGLSFKVETAEPADSVAGMLKGVGGDGKSWPAFFYNGLEKYVTPKVKPCDGFKLATLLHATGSMAQTLVTTEVPIPVGGFWRRTAEVNFGYCRDFVIENDSDETIEVPIQVRGSVAGDEFLGDAGFGGKMRAFAEIRVEGTVAGQTIKPHLALDSDEGSGPLMPELSTNLVDAIVVSSGKGRSIVPINVKGSAKVMVQVKAGGPPLISLPGGATAIVDLPGSIEIGMFRGFRGKPLPANVVISDLASGFVFVSTVPRVAFQRWEKGQAILRVMRSAGRSYALQESTDLLIWKDVSRHLGDSSVDEVVVPITDSGRFFRVRWLEDGR